MYGVLFILLLSSVQAQTQVHDEDMNITIGPISVYVDASGASYTFNVTNTVLVGNVGNTLSCTATLYQSDENYTTLKRLGFAPSTGQAMTDTQGMVYVVSYVVVVSNGSIPAVGTALLMNVTCDTTATDNSNIEVGRAVVQFAQPTPNTNDVTVGTKTTSISTAFVKELLIIGTGGVLAIALVVGASLFLKRRKVHLDEAKVPLQSVS
jgi:hypothetical protein